MSLFILTCRNFNKYYKYILFSPIFLLINNISFGLNYHNIFKEINIKNIKYIFNPEYEEPKGFRQFFIRQIFCYLVTIIFSFIFYKIENKTKGGSSIFSIEENEEDNNKIRDSQIKLIHQKSENIYYSNTFFLYLIFIIILWVILDQAIEKLHNILKHLDLWMLELIFLSIFSNTILNIKIYTHQVIAMLLTVFPLLLKLATIILSFYDEKIGQKENDKYYREDINLEIPYVYQKWLIPIGIIIYSFLILLKAYISTKIKWYMDIKYISSHKLLILYGLIGALFYSILCTISTFNECEKTYNSTKNIVDYFCEIQPDNTKNNEITKYLANYNLYFKSFSDIGETFLELLAVFLGASGFFFYKYFCLMIIKYLSPIHLMFAIPPFYLVAKIIMLAYTYLFYGTEQENKFDRNNIFKVKFILDSIGDIFCIISNLIYLEILELNFCNLNYNLREAITERGLLDIYGDDEIDIFNEDNDENQEENKSEDINSITGSELSNK